jgi:hypothetical protein
MKINMSMIFVHQKQLNPPTHLDRLDFAKSLNLNLDFSPLLWLDHIEMIDSSPASNGR